MDQINSHLLLKAVGGNFVLYLCEYSIKEDGYVVIQRNRLFYIIENYVLTNESAEPSSKISMVGVCQCDKKILWTFSTKLEHSCTVLRLYHKNEQEICYDQDYQEDNTDGHRIDILDLVWILRITFNLNMLSGGFAEA